jgi:hypothetical protein
MSIRRAVASVLLLAPLAVSAQPLDVARDAMERLHAPPAPAAPAKPLDPTVEKGLAWLAKTQLANGAWGQGEESAQMGSNVAIAQVGSVADTGVAVLAMLRAGNSATAGAYAKPLRRGLEFVLGEIEASDADSLYVTGNRSTRVQAKIGTYVDTFVSSMLLAEIKGHTGDPALEKRVETALAKVLKKIEKNQRDDGSWDNAGWAPTLSQAVATKGINRAAQKGVAVAEATRRKTEAWGARQLDGGGGFAAEGSAGVGLYAAASSVSSLADNVATNDMADAELKKQAAGGDDAQRARAQVALKANEQAKDAHQTAEQALIARLDDPGFVAGFGSNGGEEFLSYMLISESLVAKGGAEWKRWDAAMRQNLARVQNGDGSWTGHHCITGRTFCTAAALLVLMADRAPVPTASKLGARG